VVENKGMEFAQKLARVENVSAKRLRNKAYRNDMKRGLNFKVIIVSD